MTTNDAAAAERLRRLRVHGGATEYHHDEVGFNSRLDALQAAVLSAKLPHLAGWSAKRRQNAEFYDRAFADLADVRTPVVRPENESIFNQYTIRVLDGRRDALQESLKAAGIGSAIYYPVPLHLQECFDDLGYREGDFPHAEAAAQESLALPVYPELTEAQQRYVVQQIRSFYAS